MLSVGGRPETGLPGPLVARNDGKCLASVKHFALSLGE